MNPKQSGITEATYQFPWGPKSIGIVKLDNGHSVVTASGLTSMIGYYTAGHLTSEYRLAMCRGGTDPSFRCTSRQVFGLRGICDVLDRGRHQLTAEECDDLIEWFRQQGVSETLWPVAVEPFTQKRHTSFVPASIGNGTAATDAGSPFDAIREMDSDGREFWSARRLMVVLGYGRWQESEAAIERAILCCRNSGQSDSDHLWGATQMVEIGSGATREVKDYHMSRYGCYLVALNGDPRKPEVAAAQQYFIVRTRQAETQAEGLDNENIAKLLLLLTEQTKLANQNAIALVDHERRITDAADKAEKALAEIQRMQDARPVFEGIWTIQEFARHLGCPLQSARKIKDRQELGQFLTAVCEDRGANFVRGYRTTELGHSVNGYPLEILREHKNHFIDFEGTRPERAVVIPRLKKLISDQKPTAFDFTRRSN